MKSFNIKLNHEQYRQFPMQTNKNIVKRIVINRMMIQMILGSNADKHYCDCCRMELIKNAKTLFEAEYVEELMALIYFQLVIDQTLYFILVDNRLNAECLNEVETYLNYDKLFNFIKMQIHCSPEQTSPVSFLDFRNSDTEIYLLDKKELLMDAKVLLWDKGVKQYFLSLGRNDIVSLSEMEFRRDLTLRHRFSEDEETKLKYLFESN